METGKYEEIKEVTRYLTSTFAISSNGKLIGMRFRKGIESVPVIIGIAEGQKGEKMRKLMVRCQIPLVNNEKLAVAIYYYLFFQEEKKEVKLPEQLYEQTVDVIKEIIQRQMSSEIPADHKKRCEWCGDSSILAAYHDFYLNRFHKKNDKTVLNALVFDMYAEKFDLETTIKEEELIDEVWEKYNLKKMLEKKIPEQGDMRLLIQVKENAEVAKNIIDMYGSLHSFFERLSGGEEQKISTILVLFKGLSKESAKRFLERIDILTYKHDDHCFLNKK